MLRAFVYPKIEGPLKTIAGFLNKQGFTPNQLTVGGLGLNLVAACFLLNGHFTSGALMILIAGMGDLLDGVLARETGKSSPFGAFLDSFVDRYSEFFLYGSLALYFARQQQGLYLVLVLGIIAGSFAVSYAKARAENFIPDCATGIFDRGLRLVLLFCGTLIPFFLPPVLWILCIGSNATALQRFFHTKKELNADEDSVENKES